MESILKPKKLWNTVDRGLERNMVRWGCAALIAGLLIVFIKFRLGFVFASADDYTVLFSVAGYFTGQPYPEISFMNYLYTRVFCLLYSLCDWLPWYGLYFLGIHWITGTVFVYSILTIGSRSRISKGWLLLFAVVLSVGALLLPMHRMQFTVTSSMAGAASIGLLLSADWKAMSKRQNTVLYVLSTIFLFLSYLQRPMSGKVAIAFWAVALCYHLFRQLFVHRCQLKPVLVRLAATMGIFLVLMGAIFSTNYYSTHYGDNAEYLQSGFNSYRAKFQDYIRPNVTYDEVRDLAESVGWDRDMWDMLYSMFYFDDRWNVDTAKEFVDSYYASAAANGAQDIPSLTSAALRTVKDTLTFVWNDESVLFLVVAQAICLVLLVWIFCKDPRRRWGDLLAGLASFGAAMLLMAYLSMSGRLILRAAQTALIPAAFLTIGVTLTALEELRGQENAEPAEKRNLEQRRRHVVRIGSIGLAALVLIALEIPIYTSLAGDVVENTAAKDSLKSIEVYAVQHPENVYIYDFTFGGDPASLYPFTVYQDPPINLMRHGGWIAMTPLYQHQMETNGFENFSAEDYLQDNLYFITRDPKNNPKQNFHTLLRYLDHMLGNVYAETVDVLPNEVYVIQFRKSDVQDDRAFLPGYSKDLTQFGTEETGQRGTAENERVIALYVGSDGFLRDTPESPDAPIQYWVSVE